MKNIINIIYTDSHFFLLRSWYEKKTLNFQNKFILAQLYIKIPLGYCPGKTQLFKQAKTKLKIYIFIIKTIYTIKSGCSQNNLWSISHKWFRSTNKRSSRFWKSWYRNSYIKDRCWLNSKVNLDAPKTTIIGPTQH